MYYIEASKETPLVSLNLEKGVFLIDGDCISESPDDFFNNISNCIENYSNNTCKNTTLTINLGGINISSSKFLLNIIYQLESIYKSGQLENSSIF